MMDSFASKALLILVQAVCLHVSVTPPNPPPPASERVQLPSNTQKRLPALANTWGPRIVKSLLALTFLSELYVLATYAAHPTDRPRRLFSSSNSTKYLDIEALRPTALFYASIVLQCVATYIRYACYRELGALFTFEVMVHEKHKLITTGPYAIVRHPSYTASLLFCLGSAACLLGPGSWLAANGVWDAQVHSYARWCILAYVLGYNTMLTRMFLARTVREDALLRQHFGQEWEEYAGRTPYRLVPYLY